MRVPKIDSETVAQTVDRNGIWAKFRRSFSERLQPGTVVDRVRQHKKNLVLLVFVLVPSLFCNMATKGKQLRFNLERERERSCFSCCRRGRRVLEFSFVGTLPWTKLPGSSWPCTLTSSPASLRSPRETFLSNNTEREKTGAWSNLGQTSRWTRRTQASSSSWSRQTEMGAERLAATSSTPHVRRRRRSSSSSRSLSSCAVRRWAVSWSICSWTRRWLVLNHETVEQLAEPTNEMQNSFRRQPATRRRRPYSNPVG